MRTSAFIVRAVVLLTVIMTCFAGCGAPGSPADPVQPPLPAALRAQPAGCQGHEDEHDSAELRLSARRPVRWQKHRITRERELPVRLLAINDFHGQLSPRTVGMRPAGGAAVLASYLQSAAAGAAHSFIVHAGDLVGASPPSSALLQDEPTISFFNLLGNDDCTYDDVLRPACNLVGIVGNHELDEGTGELLRLIRGGNHPEGPFLEDPWRGARYPYVSANVIDTARGEALLPPYVIKRVPGVPIAFIGATLEATPSVVTPTGVAGLQFQDEADAINRVIPELHAQGVHTIVVVIHQGLTQTIYDGATREVAAAPSGPLLEVVERLDDDVDVVISGHTHQFTNAIIANANGAPILVTQAMAAGTAYSEIDLVLDRDTNDVVSKTARVVTTWGDEGPGLEPDPRVAELVAKADASVAPLVNVVVGQAGSDITRTQNAAGESALGNLIADSQRSAVGADFAVMNPGGIRTDLSAGEVSWGDVFAIQPFGNSVVSLSITGQQLYDLLNQQWGGEQPAGGRLLQVSGFSYTWDSRVAEGESRVVEVRNASGPIARDGRYTLAANSFLAAGGDNFTVLTMGTDQLGGPVDLDALIAYIGSLPPPFNATVEGRIIRQ